MSHFQEYFEMNHRTFNQHPNSSSGGNDIVIVGAGRQPIAGAGRVIQRSSPSGYMAASRQQHVELRPSTTSTAGKVAEVFLTASHAFQKLGDLILPLHTPISESTDNNKWSDRDVDRLKEALSRFAQELDSISDGVQARTIKHIKTDIKRYSTIGQSDMRTPLNYTNITSGGNNNTPTSSMHNQSSDSRINEGDIESNSYNEGLSPKRGNQMDNSSAMGHQQQQQFGTSSPPRLQQEQHGGIPIRTRVVHLASGGQSALRSGGQATVVKRQHPGYVVGAGTGLGGSVLRGSGPPPLKRPMVGMEGGGGGMDRMMRMDGQGSSPGGSRGSIGSPSSSSIRQSTMGQHQQPSTTFRAVRNEMTNTNNPPAQQVSRIATRSSEAAAAAASNMSLRSVV